MTLIITFSIFSFNTSNASLLFCASSAWSFAPSVKSSIEEYTWLIDSEESFVTITISSDFSNRLPDKFLSEDTISINEDFTLSNSLAITPVSSLDFISLSKRSSSFKSRSPILLRSSVIPLIGLANAEANINAIIAATTDNTAIIINMMFLMSALALSISSNGGVITTVHLFLSLEKPTIESSPSSVYSCTPAVDACMASTMVL